MAHKRDLFGNPARAALDSAQVWQGDSLEGKGFKAARRGRRSNFESDRTHVNTSIRKGGELLRARSRFFCRENPLGIAAKATWSAYAFGTGILPNMLGVSLKAKKAWMAAYAEFVAHADFDGVTDLNGLICAGVDEEFDAGEFFLRRIEGGPDGRLQIQGLSSEQLPYNARPAEPLADGHTIRLGIEFDAKNRKVAYHFLRYHPQDSSVTARDRLQTERVPFDEVIHVFKLRQFGQLRGIPRTVGALIPGSKLDEYEDSLLERAAAGTRPIGFIERPEGEGAGTGSGMTAGAKDNGDGSATLDMEPGTLIEGEPGEKLASIPAPDPGANYKDFGFRQETRACSAMGVPRAETTGDLTNVNFSSMRAGRIPFKKRIEQFQYLQLVPQALQRIWEWFVADALLRGSVALPRGASRTVAAYSRLRWMGPKWEYVNPLQDVQADVAAVDNLLVPRSDVISANGEDPEETDDRIAEEQRREGKLNIKRRGKAAEQEPADQNPDGGSNKSNKKDGEA